MLRAMIDFAVDMGTTQDYVEAEALARATYEAQLKVLGLDHPDTLHSLHNLAINLSDLGE